LFQALPFHEPAFKTNLVSAVFGAITVANLALLVRLVTGNWRGAIIGACSLSVAHTFWQHCALAEVYTVTTALLVLELICLHQYLLTRRLVWICLLFFVNGLGISNHMFASLSLVCYAVLIGVMVGRRELSIKLIPILLLVWTAGASIYLALILRQLAHGAGLLPTIHSALFGDFSRSVLNLLPSGRQLKHSVLYLCLNFPTPAVFLALVGLWRLHSIKPWPQWFVVLLALSVIHLVWAARYDVPDQYTFFIPFIVLVCIWVGLGADVLLCRYPKSFPWVVLASLLPAAVYLPLPKLAHRLHVSLGVAREIPYREEYEYF
jgi:Protein O-mannosyl-transferase TMEM260-like